MDTEEIDFKRLTGGLMIDWNGKIVIFELS